MRAALFVCLIVKGATIPRDRLLPGMPPILDPNDIYSADHAGNLSPVVQNFPPRIYVPNTESNTVTVIDPATYKVIETFHVGRQPQHVTPSYDLKTLWVLNDKGNSLTEIDPATGKKGKTIHVDDPYNMYYTPDGKYAIVVAEQRMRLMFRDAADHEADETALDAVQGRRPHGFFRRRPLPDRQLRVRRQADQGGCRRRRSWSGCCR